MKLDRSNWYALFVESGQEEKVKARLDYKLSGSMKVLIPKRKLKERKGGCAYVAVRKLFPGYVLLNGDINVYKYYALKGIPGVFNLLKTGHEPAVINYWEMEVLNRLMCNGDTIDFSHCLMQNSRVVVVDGPLLSMEGRILSVDNRKCRAKVNITFLGEPRVVELGISLLQPA
jgi:transcriptional antiterminator NusG